MERSTIRVPVIDEKDRAGIDHDGPTEGSTESDTHMQLTDRRFFGLLGEVVDGNPTQEMIEESFVAAGLPWSYISIPVPMGSFVDAFEAARLLGFAGLHITKPYKIDAVAVVDDLTPEAAKIGAVNCVYRASDRLVGDNTDGRGLVRALAGTRRVEDASVVVLGAGGAARAIAMELGLAGARKITIVNRTAAAGDSLVDALVGAVDAECRCVPWSGEFVVPGNVDLVVNATSIGMLDPAERPHVNLSMLGSDAVVADAVIAPRDTAILADAAGRGLRVVAGAEMLVKQAAISFELWAGRPADEVVLRAALDESLVE